jgi:hypothetical protein
VCRSGDEWQARLAAHFDALAHRRSVEHGVFALEHGLAEGELAELRRVVLPTFSRSSERARHWLPLVVHAAEVAYHYSGDEYWPSFGRQTPSWDPSQSGRHEVRDAFQRFAREFRGHRPHGQWADWFSIICWPIGNAVLPTDMQRQMARALYRAGPGLARRLDDIGELGRYVGDAAWEASDRFQQLRDQPELLGQIALALLRPQATADALLLESTLQRIARDLVAERAAAAWLREARRAAEKPRAGYGGPKLGLAGSDRGPADAEVEQSARLLKPEVLLRFDATSQKWIAWLSLPNLSPLAELSPAVRGALLSSKAVAPAADAPISRGRFLFDSQEVRLSRWPAAADPLLRLEGLAAGLEAALLRAWAGPELPAVFRIQADGRTARRVESRIVRPGQSYVVAYRAAPEKLRRVPNQSPYSDVYVTKLELPRVIDPALADDLRRLQCVPAQSSTVWPAACIPVAWDGDGVVEWLTTDRPLLGLRADYHLAELTFEIKGHPPESRKDVSAGEVLFLTIPSLSPGEYDLRVVESTLLGRSATRQMVVRIREPRSSISGAGPVRIWPEPYSADLGQLWSGQASVCVAGPASEAQASLTLATRPAGTVLARADFPVTVPLGVDDWRRHWSLIVHGNTEVARAYDEARWARVEVDAARFGKHALEFERSIPPLRWVLHESDHGALLTLRDDGEPGAPPEVAHMAFDCPNRAAPQACEPEVAFSVDDRGGLYVARRGLDSSVILAPPRQRVFRSFAELQFEASIQPVPLATPALAEAIDILGLWSRAILPGHALARTRRAQVVRSLHQYLVGVLAGPNWAAAERSEVGGARGRLWQMERILDGSAAATKDQVRWILRFVENVGAYSTERRIDLLRPLMARGPVCAGAQWAPIARRRRDSAAEWAAEFCLRLASDPAVGRWAGGSLSEGIALTRFWPLPLRVARFLVLATTHGDSAVDSYPPLFGGWTWE